VTLGKIPATGGTADFTAYVTPSGSRNEKDQDSNSWFTIKAHMEVKPCGDVQENKTIIEYIESENVRQANDSKSPYPSTRPSTRPTSGPSEKAR
jgi:hypothetical protein